LDDKLGRFYVGRRDKHLSKAAKAFLAMLRTQTRKLS
jgi:hypothetical protein